MNILENDIVQLGICSRIKRTMLYSVFVLNFNNDPSSLSSKR